MTRLRKTKKAVTSMLLMSLSSVAGFLVGGKAADLTETDYSYTNSDITLGARAYADTQSDSDGGDACFVAGSQVAMKDGGSKNIEEIEEGEEVQAYDETTGEVVHATVLEIHHTTSTQGYYDINNGALKLTANHPVYVQTGSDEHGWAAVDAQQALEVHGVSSKKLEVGDMLYLVDGSYEEIKSIDEVSGEVPVYNLASVSGVHTYFVNNVLVHNKGSDSGSGGGANGAGPL